MREGVSFDAIVDAVNVCGEATDTFEWAAPFEGESGAVISTQASLAFADDSAPWYVMIVDPDDPEVTVQVFWCAEAARYENNQQGPADWRGLLREANCEHVLFLKARL